MVIFKRRTKGISKISAHHVSIQYGYIQTDNTFNYSSQKNVVSIQYGYIQTHCKKTN